LITFSPEFAKALGVQGTISAGNAVMYCYIGLVAGDLASGLLSQLLQSRRKAVLFFLLLTVAAVGGLFPGCRRQRRDLLRDLRGARFRHRYWAIFVTVPPNSSAPTCVLPWRPPCPTSYAA